MPTKIRLKIDAGLKDFYFVELCYDCFNQHGIKFVLGKEELQN